MCSSCGGSHEYLDVWKAVVEVREENFALKESRKEGRVGHSRRTGWRCRFCMYGCASCIFLERKEKAYTSFARTSCARMTQFPPRPEQVALRRTVTSPSTSATLRALRRRRVSNEPWDGLSALLPRYELQYQALCWLCTAQKVAYRGALAFPIHDDYPVLLLWLERIHRV